MGGGRVCVCVCVLGATKSGHRNPEKEIQNATGTRGTGAKGGGEKGGTKMEQNGRKKQRGRKKRS